MVNDKGILLFYGWWQLGVCLFAFIALCGIYQHLGKKQGDTGQIWLALSILSWSFSGAVEVLYAKDILPENPTTLEGFRSLFSLLNSLFILLGLPWFRYLPQRFSAIIKSRYWPIIIGIPFGFAFLPTLTKMLSGRAMGLISELDVYYAIFTLAFLGYVLWESFARRGLHILSWLSLICIITTFAAQLLKVSDSSVDMLLLSAIFKTTLIMLFFALALSWVKELMEYQLPPVSKLHMLLRHQKVENGRSEHMVAIEGLKSQTIEIRISPAQFSLLKTFVTYRMNNEKWLEIKPKHNPRPDRDYEINDHNEIKRLTTTLLDGIYGKNNWRKEVHEAPFKSQIYDLSRKRERKISLAIPAENLQIAE